MLFTIDPSSKLLGYSQAAPVGAKDRVTHWVRLFYFEMSEQNQDSSFYRERVYEIVRRIPSGRVMTYGQIADMLGEGYSARTVGYTMHAADERSVPWQRVINAQGGCSTGRVILPPDKQQRLLEAEGIHFDARGRCDLSQYRWTPDEAQTSSTPEPQPSLFNK